MPLARRGDPQAQLVTFPSRDADVSPSGAPTTIEGVLFRPAGAGPFPAVVVLHGCAGLYRETPEGGSLAGRDREWAYRLRDLGYVVLMPDSFTTRGVREICHGNPDPLLKPEVDRARDAFGALAFLAQQPWVQADRVGLMGWSNGAMTVLATIEQGTKARAAAQPMTTDFRVAVAFYAGCRKELERRWVTKTPLTMLSGVLDDWTPAAPCVELVKRSRAEGQPVEIVLYPGAFHDFDAPNLAIHQLSHIPSTPSGSATVGTDPAARADAIKRVPEILAAALAR
jgi:dienelactone hydrolase